MQRRRWQDDLASGENSGLLEISQVKIINEEKTMKRVAGVGLILVALSLCSSIRSQGSPVPLEPVREQEFIGRLERDDSYRLCRIDSKGNLFLLTRDDVVQKLSVDGSANYEINFRDDAETPLGIHEIAVGPDDVLYVVGVDLARTGTAIYRVLPGDNWPVLVRQIPDLEPCRCAVASDSSLHVVSFETGWINEVLLESFNPATSERFDRTTKSMPDVSVRRFSRDGRNASGYAPVRLPLDKNELSNAIRDLCDNMLAADRTGGSHVLDARTGDCSCYSSDGIPSGKSRLQLDGSREGKPAILQMVSLGADYFAYKVVFTDPGNLVIKRSDLIVARHQTGIQRRIELKGGQWPYQLDGHPQSDKLIQYWFIKDRIFTRTYKISDLVKQ
jgi:hypothetical protein